MRAFVLVVAACVSMSVAVGCAAQNDEGAVETSASTTLPAEGAGDQGDDGDLEDAPVVGADDSAAPSAEAVAALAGVAQVRTTKAVMLHVSGSPAAATLAIVPEGMILDVASTTATNGFYNVHWAGVTGYISASYLAAEGDASELASPDVDVNGPASPANAIARAAAVTGFSYYWGGGAWLAGGPSASTRGSCTGTCPSCTHHGAYGADCSGMVAKAWQFGPTSLSTNAHPYATSAFVTDVAGRWKTVSRGALKAGDALVYNSGDEGHIVLYEKGDGWGSPTVYECRGCAYGCVHDTRSFASAYHGIRREGF